MMKISRTDALYFLLPLLLWPLSFIILQNIFIYALLLSVTVLALFSLHRGGIRWVRGKSKELPVLAGIAGAFLLYLIFFFGNSFSNHLGLQQFVASVYTAIYRTSGPDAVSIIVLALIGVFEEIYWRGGVQGYVESNFKRFRSVPWTASAAYYGAVHIFTLNPILAVAALLVGIVTGVIAYKYGIAASIMAHVLWLEAIVMFFPV